MQPHVEDEDPEIVALTKKINALWEKRAREEEEQRRQEEEERKAREAVEKVRREELERAKAVEITREQEVGRKQSPTPETEGDRMECA